MGVINLANNNNNFTHRQRVLLALKQGSKTIGMIDRESLLDKEEIEEILSDLEKEKLVKHVEINGMIYYSLDRSGESWRR